MPDAPHEHLRRPPDSPLSPGELSARRAAARRLRARRRRGVAATVLGTVAVLIAIVALSGGKSAPREVIAATRPAAARVHHSAPRHPPAARAQAAARPPSVERILGYTSYVQLAGRGRREVALTFDDGPSPYTPQILHVLRRMNAPATFFVIGRSARAYPQFLADEARAGFEVGDHTESHPPLAVLSPSAQAAEIAEAAQAIRRAGAPAPMLFRPPYGSFNGTTLQILHGSRMLMVLWSADTKDYSRPGVSRIVYTAVSGAQPGEIVLMHDGGGERSETVAALPRIITRLRQRGFRLVTVSQLVNDDPPPRNQASPHPLSGGI